MQACLLFSADDNCTDDPTETKDPTEQQTKKDKLIVCTVSIVCSCGKDPTNTAGQKCQSFGHTATLILAISIVKDCPTSEDTAKIGNKDESCLTMESQLCPYILVYDMLTVNSESAAKPLFNVDSNIELEKEMMLQDPYTPSGSEDDWIYDVPVLPPDTLHSSVLQKFAEAIAGEENGEKEKAKKSKEETSKSKLVQCLDLSGVCKDQHCKVLEIVPFGDGQNLLVNFVCCSSCDNKKELDPSDSNPENGETVEPNVDPSDVSASNSAQENHPKFLIHEHNFNQSTLAVYKIVNSNGERTLSPQPTRTKQFTATEGILSSMVTLPVESHDLLGDTNICFQEPDTELSLPSQLFVGAANGSVVVIDVNSLNIITKFTASNESSKITHVLNCPGMDCFCACTEEGMMRFLGLRNQLPSDTGVSTAGQDKTDGISNAPPGGSWSQSGK